MKRTLLVAGSCLVAACASDSAPSLPNPSAHLASLPIDLASLDATQATTASAAWALVPTVPIFDYGTHFSAPVENKINHQPTFYAPMGTPVLATASGRVSRVTELEGYDYVIWIDGGNNFQYELEHVLAPTVREGDLVTAGEPVALVSDYECQRGNMAYCDSGFGVVEMGLFWGGFGGDTLVHYCPFTAEVIDDTVEASTFAALDDLRDRVEAVRGDTNYWPQDTWETPQCPTLRSLTDAEASGM